MGKGVKMALGPGKYDAVCTVALEAAKAEGVLLIVLGGQFGSGFSVQASPEVLAVLPLLLRQAADEIEGSFPSA
jgi:hypothetical protein